MPLPDATPDKRIYELLKTVDLENLTFADLQAVGQTIYAEQGAEDELRRLILLNLARLSVVGEWTGLTSAGSSGISATMQTDAIAAGYRRFIPGKSAMWGSPDTATGTVYAGMDAPHWRPFIASQSGNITEIGVYVVTAHPTTGYDVGVYTDNAGFPDTLLGYAAMDCSAVGTVYQTSFSATITLEKDKQYWVGYVKNGVDDARLRGLNNQVYIGTATGLASSQTNQYTYEDTVVTANQLPTTCTPGNFTTQIDSPVHWSYQVV